MPPRILRTLLLAALVGAPATGFAQDAAPSGTATIPVQQTAPATGAETAPPAPAPDAPSAEVPDTATPDTALPANLAEEPSAPEIAAELRDETLPHNLSPWGMFMAADIVVKSVMIGLAFASLVTWTVWLAKTMELAGARYRAARAVRAISAAPTLEKAARSLDGNAGPASILVQAAREEVALSDAALDTVSGDGLKERVASRLARIEAASARRIARGTGVLATIGSTAPFVGLFGTVWGIMNAFIGISEAATTNLAVVAPGIAEALLATALGLVAAIPAVVIYNVFARSIAGYRQVIADAAAGVERLVSRDIDYRSVPRPAGRPMAAE